MGKYSDIMSSLVELVLFQAGFDRSPKLDQMVAEMNIGASALLHGLWIGQDSHLQRILLRTHADVRIWPQFRLLEKFINIMPKTLPTDVWQILEKYGCDVLWIPDLGREKSKGIDPRTDVANVPFLLGIWSYFCTNTDVWQQEGFVAQLRQIRLFDTAWFEVGFRSGLLVSLAIDQKLTTQRMSSPSATSLVK